MTFEERQDYQRQVEWAEWILKYAIIYIDFLLSTQQFISAQIGPAQPAIWWWRIGRGQCRSKKLKAYPIICVAIAMAKANCGWPNQAATSEPMLPQ
jgi:hypothetical protein